MNTFEQVLRKLVIFEMWKQILLKRRLRIWRWEKIKYNVCILFPSNLNGYQSRLVPFPSHWNWWRQTFSTFFESKVFYPLKKFFTPILPHTFSLWLLYHICYYLTNIPSYITSIKYRMFVKVFYPFFIFWKVFYPTYESKMIWKFDEEKRECLSWKRW